MSGHPFFLAWWHAVLGHMEESLFWLERNMEMKYKFPFFFDLIGTNPDFSLLRDDPRFLAIIDVLGLGPYHHSS